MISYEHESSNFDIMSVLSLMDDYSDCRNEVNQNQCRTSTGISDSTHFEIFHNLDHYDKENIWLQDNVYCSESNRDNQTSTDQQQFSDSNLQYVDITSKSRPVTPCTGFETQQYIQTYSSPNNHTPQLLQERKTQSKCYQQRSDTHRISRSIGKCHRAYISFIPTQEGNFKTIIKRKRTVFTTGQLEALEEYFSQYQYVTRQERQKLVNKLNLNDRAVKFWFQNRRLKSKRDQEPQASCVVNSETLKPCLDYVESQINERTNELGYVTLDDTLTENLFDVIDTVLANRNHVDISCDNSSVPDIENDPYSESVPSTEVSYPDWEMIESQESLQRNLDLQSILSL